MVNGLYLYSTFWWPLKVLFITVCYSPIHTHIHTVHLLAALIFSMTAIWGFSILPKDTSASRWGRLWSNCRPSGRRTPALHFSHKLLYTRGRQPLLTKNPYCPLFHQTKCVWSRKTYFNHSLKSFIYSYTQCCASSHLKWTSSKFSSCRWKLHFHI